MKLSNPERLSTTRKIAVDDNRVEIITRSARSAMDVTIKKYFENNRFWWSKFSWNIEWDRRLSFHSFNFVTFIDCCPCPSAGPPSEELWLYPACFPETAAGFETHYNPDDIHLDNVANQCRQAKVKKSLHRPTHRPPLPTRAYSWYSFQLDFEKNPGPKCGEKNYVNEK